ncbi:MAG TPA: GxxExxY protein [Gammaproteobacteria bacterium]
MRYKDVTQQVIGCAFTVHKGLGGGFLEKVYENALLLELREAGLRVQQQFPVPVFYRNERAGEYFADLPIEDVIVCEVKAAVLLAKEHELQLVNYLCATGLDAGLLINFGKSVAVRRKFRKYKNPVNPVHSSHDIAD